MDSKWSGEIRWDVQNKNRWWPPVESAIFIGYFDTRCNVVSALCDGQFATFSQMMLSMASSRSCRLEKSHSILPRLIIMVEEHCAQIWRMPRVVTLGINVEIQDVEIQDVDIQKYIIQNSIWLQRMNAICNKIVKCILFCYMQNEITSEITDDRDLISFFRWKMQKNFSLPKLWALWCIWCKWTLRWEKQSSFSKTVRIRIQDMNLCPLELFSSNIVEFHHCFITWCRLTLSMRWYRAVRKSISLERTSQYIRFLLKYCPNENKSLKQLVTCRMIRA